MSNIVVSGLLNLETTTKVKEFPIPYFPIEYPFFGVQTSVSGVGYNIAKALKCLGDEVTLLSYLADDLAGAMVLSELSKVGVNTQYIKKELQETPASVVLHEETGRRQIYCDLKDIQEKRYPEQEAREAFVEKEIFILCNINFNRELISKARQSGKLVATDVHVIGNVEDEYNKIFMQNADLLFLSNEAIIGREISFLKQIARCYQNRIIVIGQGCDGALMYDRENDCIYDVDSISVAGVVNTVGAGDALFSAFVHYYGLGMSPIECLKRAEIFAAHKIQYNGAAAGFIGEEEIEELYRDTSISIRIIE